MIKTYIVTARSAEDAARKIKALRTRDDPPIMEPTESNFEKFIDQANEVIGAVKLEDLETKFNEVQEKIQFNVVQLLNDCCTTGNIWWDFKKLLEQKGADADLEMVKKGYEKFIDKFVDFKNKYEKAGEKLADAKNKKTVTTSWVPWFDKAIDRAKENLAVSFDDAKDRKEKLEEKAKAPKTYNKVV